MVTVICLITPNPLHDFPAMMDYNLEFELKSTISPLGCFCQGVFIIATEMKLEPHGSKVGTQKCMDVGVLNFVRPSNVVSEVMLGIQPTKTC